MRAGVDALADHWFPVARAGAIRDKPLRVVVFGTPLVVVRGSNGQPWVFEDRCPHRGGRIIARPFDVKWANVSLSWLVVRG